MVVLYGHTLTEIREEADYLETCGQEVVCAFKMSQLFEALERITLDGARIVFVHGNKRATFSFNPTPCQTCAERGRGVSA